MPASFPATLSTLGTTYTDGVDTVAAAIDNQQAFEINAIEATLGTTILTPTWAATWTGSGSFATAAARLNNLEAGITADTHTQYTKITGGSTIQPTAAIVGLGIQGAVSQTANLQEWRNSSATVLANVSPSGVLTASGITTSGTVASGPLTSTTAAHTGATSIVLGSDSVGLLVKGASGQASNLQEWRSSAGTLLGNFTAAGVLQVGGATVLAGVTASSSAPQPLGVAAAGVSTALSRDDHVHLLPTPTTIGAIATSALTSTNPGSLGTAGPGVSTNVARLDHIHPTTGLVDTSSVQSAIAGAKTFTAALTASGGLTTVSPTADASTGVRQITSSTAAPSGGADGDIWLKHA